MAFQPPGLLGVHIHHPTFQHDPYLHHQLESLPPLHLLQQIPVGSKGVKPSLGGWSVPPVPGLTEWH